METPTSPTLVGVGILSLSLAVGAHAATDICGDLDGSGTITATDAQRPSVCSTTCR
jgi:hypothetical protein